LDRGGAAVPDATIHNNYTLQANMARAANLAA